MKTVVSTKGQIVIPSDIRTRDSITAGDCFELKRVRAGEYSLRRVGVKPNSGLTDWLLECPVKDFFKPIESESTDTL